MDRMDSSSHPNWLVFSLSNHSLFQPSTGAVADRQNGNASDHNPPVLGGGGPKLEDFLGGSSAGPSVAQFDGGVAVQMYDDSELKSIAASFLQGFSTDQTPKQLAVAAPPKKAVETFGHRTSIFRGVTRHRWTGRYEAHLWDNSCRREGQSRKGRQVYLGGYDKEEKAARAYDLAALKYWGPTTTTNFPVSDYEREMEEMKHMTRQEFVASLRRKSSGFSRGASIYRGVTRHHQHGRWQARIGRVAGNKDLYLGTFSTQEEAAEAYDIAAIKFRGLNAVTNFDMSRYDVKSIASSNLPVGGGSATNKPPKPTSESASDNRSMEGIPCEDGTCSATSLPFPLPSQSPSPTINFALPIKQDQSSSLWAALGYPRNPSNSATMFQEGTTPYSTEFHPTEANSNGFFNGCGYNYQECEGTTSSSGCTTRVVSNGTSHDAVGFSNNGGWIPQAVHAFQGGKTNLSSFQTPIFGIE
ncbi:hypothetical protein ACS0TY_024535 [Phlomoides rotata]